MKKVIQHIALFTLVAIFVAASGGFFFILHHCNAHHSTELLFVKNGGDECCRQAAQKSSGGCCSEEAACAMQKPVIPASVSGNIKCCTSNAVFIKVFFQFVKSSVEQVQISMLNLGHVIAPILNMMTDAGTLYPGRCLVWPPGGGSLLSLSNSSFALRL